MEESLVEAAEARQKRTAVFVCVIGSVTLIAALMLARDILVPLTLAVLLSFVLAPPVLWLGRFGMPRAPAVLAVVIATAILVMGLGAIVGKQIVELAQSAPQYEANLRVKSQALRIPLADGMFSGAARTFNRLKTDFEQPAAASAAPQTSNPSAQTSPAAPIPVEVHTPSTPPLQSLLQLIGSLFQSFATVGIVVIVVIFILLEREELRDRFIRLAGSTDLGRTTTAMNEAVERLSRFFLIQTCVNAAFGITVALGLWIIGVPSPAIWGIFAGLLRFVPFIGGIIGGIFPLMLAMAVDPGWSMALWVLALFAISEPLFGYFLEPWLQGRMTGLSPFAIIAAVVFWSWAWGPVGLILATPLTVLLVVIGRHVRSLEFLDVLFSDTPALAPKENFYQRLLAGDPNEAMHQAEQHLKTMSLTRYFDTVAMEGLHLAQLDLKRGMLAHSRLAVLGAGINEILENLRERKSASAEPPGAGSSGPPLANSSTDELEQASELPVIDPAVLPPIWRSGAAILGVGGRNVLDVAAARMLAMLLDRHGLAARVVLPDEVTASNVEALEAVDVQCLFVCYLEPASVQAHFRYLVRRLRRRFPDAKILACFWNNSDVESGARQLAAENGADGCAVSLREAMAWLLAQVPAESIAAPRSLAATPAPIAIIELTEPKLATVPD